MVKIFRFTTQRFAAFALPFILVLAMQACGQSRPPQRSEPRPARLSVENKHWLDVVLYVEYGGRRARVGQVTAAAEAAFALPWRVLGPSGQIRLIADPVGSADGLTSPTIVVRPGQRVDWTLERDLSASSISVR